MEIPRKAHCLILPYPLQGHINPMLQFSKRLQQEGIKITVAITKFFFKKLQKVSCSFSVETISDGFDGGKDETVDLESYLDTFQRVGSETLSELVLKLQNSGDSPVDCIVCDPFLPWVLDVAQKFGISGAVFFTQSCAVDNIYYHIYKGMLKLPFVENEVVRVHGLPPLAPSDLPSFVSDCGSYPPLLRMVVNQFMNFEKADWLFINTFYELENEVLSFSFFSKSSVKSYMFSLYSCH